MDEFNEEMFRVKFTAYTHEQEMADKIAEDIRDLPVEVTAGAILRSKRIET